MVEKQNSVYNTAWIMPSCGEFFPNFSWSFYDELSHKSDFFCVFIGCVRVFYYLTSKLVCKIFVLKYVT